MKKIFLSISLVVLSLQNSKACSWYDPDYEYFNLFTQSIIKDQSLNPFLLSYSNAYYLQKNNTFQQDNILEWQKYFGEKLSYQEVHDLVYKVPVNELHDLKNGLLKSSLQNKYGVGFYNKYKEGIDYLIEAKNLEPYMKISYVESPDSFYFREVTDDKDATKLNYQKTISTLKSLYDQTKDPNIKLRYGYQLVRFNHYTRNYEEAITTFKNWVEPLNLKTAPYYYALNQLAGAQNGLGKTEDANWNFFQVFVHSNSLKPSAFTSMKITHNLDLVNLDSRCKTQKEKEYLTFILGYQDFNKPLPMMEELYKINPQSELLQVLAARGINELERSYLPIYYEQNAKNDQGKVPTENKIEDRKISFFQKIWNFIKAIFTGNSTKKSEEHWVNDAHRIPFFEKNNFQNQEEEKDNNNLPELMKFVEKTSAKNPQSEFWKISLAYLEFLNRNYDKSNEILEGIKTKNEMYATEISKMKMLNDVVSQPTIDKNFEKKFYKKYQSFFENKDNFLHENGSGPEAELYGAVYPTTLDFLRDIFANRYFLQGDLAKSFLMNNTLQDFRYNPDLLLAQKLETFYKKTDKNDFEKNIILKNIENVGDVDAYFSVVYGDYAMKEGQFAKAKSYYENAHSFAAYPTYREKYNFDTGEYEKIDSKGSYNGFSNVSGLIFGHNVWESFSSPANQTLKAETFVADFPTIKPFMNKLEIANTLIQLQKLGEGEGRTAANANQLIGNILYNTSALGYFRDVFVMDINNGDGGKYRFAEKPFNYTIYFKNYSSNVFSERDDFNLALGYYQKALDKCKDKEQKARILFQMASAEQGKFYQYDTSNQVEISYDDPNYDQKQKEYFNRMSTIKNQKYRSYFTILKNEYQDTETSKKLSGSCLYYQHFLSQ